MKIIYHKADFDGIFSGQIVAKYAYEFGVEPTMIGWDYGDPVPGTEPAERIIMVDISIPELMSHPGLIWIDHHKTAIDRFPKDIVGVRIDGVAACRLAYQYFAFEGQRRPKKEDFIDRKVLEPLGVRLAGEYDIWDKRDPRAETFQFGLRSEDAIDWRRMLNLDDDSYAESLVERGRALQKYQRQRDASVIASNGFVRMIHGIKFLCCNATHYNSLLFESRVTADIDAVLGFKFDPKGTWKVSLYGVPHRPDLDLSAIAAHWGGGGHRQACGFEVGTETLKALVLEP